jgi:CsoR family transcriptional regulator, copper-sensing transcriptional repressor
VTTERERAAPAGAAQPAGCGCAMPGDMADGEPRMAVAVDPDAKERNLKRLRRIEGQVRGIQKMVDEQRYCADIMTQISSVHEALRAVGRELMRNHLRHCAASAIRASDAEADAMYEELLDMVYRRSR